jgi:hypothetical protein
MSKRCCPGKRWYDVEVLLDWFGLRKVQGAIKAWLLARTLLAGCRSR